MKILRKYGNNASMIHFTSTTNPFTLTSIVSLSLHRKKSCLFNNKTHLPYSYIPREKLSDPKFMTDTQHSTFKTPCITIGNPEHGM